MTNEEAILMLDRIMYDEDNHGINWATGAKEAFNMAISALKKQIPQKTQKDLQPTCNQLATDCISRQAAIDAIKTSRYLVDAMEKIIRLPSAQSEEVTPHRNYKYLSDYWCECGNHLGKKDSVTFCSDCGRKVKWDE